MLQTLNISAFVLFRLARIPYLVLSLVIKAMFNPELMPAVSECALGG